MKKAFVPAWINLFPASPAPAPMSAPRSLFSLSYEATFGVIKPFLRNCFAFLSRIAFSPFWFPGIVVASRNPRS
ncbi:hypothetical protein OFO07_00435 [Campylobacter sp. JMF_06 NA1]|uniref:hypothetical protein n=1 Tax=Campylobacter sp. JMF_06 NA1 TaxID=2983823 RepID=UPI0022EA031F|nr:hypothetical protein [Campylobacter sp. JMF_06 NA1]MDA3077394.1 hypothetical protein [Campylobacter sp. JMF_06 NA1]